MDATGGILIYKTLMLNELTPIEKHFLESIEDKQKELEGK